MSGPETPPTPGPATSGAPDRSGASGASHDDKLGHDLAALEGAHARAVLHPRGGRRSGGRLWPLGVLALALIVASWWYVLGDPRGASAGPLSARAWQQAAQFLSDLAGLGAASSPISDPQRWQAVAGLAAETLGMSVLAAGLAGAGALATVALGSRTLTRGPDATLPPRLGAPLFVATRGLYLLTRAVPELVWALLIVFVLRPGLVAAALALAIHNFGVLGRLAADVVEDVEPGPLRALRTAGANGLQVLVYGVLPQVLPQLLTFLLYRWEIIIRATAVVGFVAGAGLGYQLRLDLSFLRYADVGLILAIYILLVWGVDLLSTGLRRLAR